MKNVVFLDYDDVVNKAMWNRKPNGSWKCTYNFPEDGSVNDLQAVQWVSEFCKKYGYSIVVSSTWRYYDNYKECLINAGLRDGISIEGCTPVIDMGNRGAEILEYLGEHPDITGYLIFDDLPPGYFTGCEDRLVQCKNGSFGMPEYMTACSMHNIYNSNKSE